jgi:hypothetical protein
MKINKLPVFILLLAVLACGKDKFQTIPQLKFKSINTYNVPINENLRVTLEYTDKEGDVDDSLVVVRQRLNRRGPVTLSPSIFNIPEFPNTNKGQFEMNFLYQFHLISGLTPIRIPGSNPPMNEPDTLLMKFVAKDKAGNKSDTLVLNTIYVER